MGKRLLIGLVTSLATGMVACLVPSFDGMSGAEDGDGGGTRSADSGSGKKDGSAGDPSSSDAGGGAAPSSDAAPDATPANARFSCGSSGTRCALHTETCCGITASTEPECRPIATPGACEGTIPCGDSADCSGGRVCCYDMNTRRGSCEATCSGSSRMTICDPDKPTCPGSGNCYGRFWGLPYCI